MGLSAALVRYIIACLCPILFVYAGNKNYVALHACNTCVVHIAGKTCANKDGFNTKATCGFTYWANPGTTPCKTCANDGTECCTRTLHIRSCIALIIRAGNPNNMLLLVNPIFFTLICLFVHYCIGYE